MVYVAQAIPGCCPLFEMGEKWTLGQLHLAAKCIVDISKAQEVKNEQPAPTMNSGSGNSGSISLGAFLTAQGKKMPDVS